MVYSEISKLTKMVECKQIVREIKITEFKFLRVIVYKMALLNLNNN